MAARRHRERWASRLAAVATGLLMVASQSLVADTSYQLQTGSAFRQVTERDQGETLVREQGMGVGINVSAERVTGPWRFGADASLAYAQLEYEGSTQLGAPLSTDSDWSEGRIGLTGGRRFEALMGTYLGGRVEYQRRTRKIRTTQDAAGLQERYDTVWFGVDARMTPIRHVALELELGCAVHSRVDVAFDSDLDSAALDLRDHCRAAISAPIVIRRTSGTAFFVRPFVSWERYPKSKPAQLTYQDEAVGRVFLPATEFAAYGIHIGFTGPLARPSR